MKNLIIAVMAVCIINSASAQTFSIPHDTVAVSITTTANMHNDITNISGSDIQVSWRVVDHNLPADWQTSFAICDNNLCYYNVNNSLLGGNSYTTAPITPTTTANYYVLPDVTNATTMGTYFVKVNMTEGSSTAIPSWYIITKWATSVSTVVPKNGSIVTYPNPATNELNVLLDNAQVVEKILITDIQGKTIYTAQISSTLSIIDVSNLSPGIYFLNAIDAKGQSVGITKFSKQ